MLHQNRHDHNRVFAPLCLVDRCRIGVHQLIQLRNIIGNQPRIKPYRQLSLLRIHRLDDADVPVKNLFVIVILHLHHFIIHTKVHAAAPKPHSHRIQRFLQCNIQICRSHHAPLHGCQYLNLSTRRPVIL